MPEVSYEWFYENETGELLKLNYLQVDYNCCGVGRYDLIDVLMERAFEIGIEEETGISYLSFTRAIEQDEGTYICKITTKIGTAESTFTLIVNEPGNCVHLKCM